MDPLVICRKVTKSYATASGAVPALRGIDLEVFPGEAVMLVGPSGCGKTTLISIIAGVLRYDSGELIVFGRNYAALSARDLAKVRGENVGFVFQAFNLIPTLTASENVAVPLILHGVPRREALKRASAVLGRMELGGRDNSYPRELSGGQQQRVAIARALVHEPKLIVCDEPTSALDHHTGMVVMELLREVAVSESRSIIVVTHDNRIFEYADRIAVMDDGAVVGEQEVPARGQGDATVVLASADGNRGKEETADKHET